MTQEQQAWKTEMLTLIKTKTTAFTPKEIEKQKLDYPERVLEKVPGFLVTPEDFKQFKIDVEALVAAMPTAKDTGSAAYKTYNKLVTESEAYYQKRYNLVHKGMYVGMWLSLGVGIGVAFGAAFKNIALGIPIGIGIGLAIGNGLEQKAVKEGRML